MLVFIKMTFTYWKKSQCYIHSLKENLLCAYYVPSVPFFGWGSKSEQNRQKCMLSFTLFCGVGKWTIK